MSKKDGLTEDAYYAQFPHASQYLEGDDEDDTPQKVAPHADAGQPVDVKALMRGSVPKMPEPPFSSGSGKQRRLKLVE